MSSERGKVGGASHDAGGAGIGTAVRDDDAVLTPNGRKYVRDGEAENASLTQEAMVEFLSREGIDLLGSHALPSRAQQRRRPKTAAPSLATGEALRAEHGGETDDD
jgi:hypothetical protein